MGNLRKILLLLLFPLLLSGQTSPTLSKSQKPPDINEIYKANPYFYEIMSAFPNNNSYYKYDFEEVKKQAKKDPELMVILGDHYRIGRSTPLDHPKAMKEYQLAASKGYAKANHRIAYMHADGLGVPKDKAKFLEYLIKSADGGYDIAQYDLALVHLNGKMGLPRDIGKAYPYLVKASAQGHRGSTELLGMVSIHAGAPAAGVPTGLETALSYFRKAGDTDSERALLQSIGSFGALRYFLRIIPGFLPGLEVIADSLTPLQGIELIQKLEKVKALTGEENFRQYRHEIAENIMYQFYYDVQGKRIPMLHFLLWCHENDEWLSPGNTRYINAISRDFRLSVQFSNRNELDDYLKEFENYPSHFEEASLPLVADRVFVSLFLKESAPDLKSTISDFIHHQTWLHRNLTRKYLYLYEDYHFELHKSAMIDNPPEGKQYLTAFGYRYCNYNPAESDTLVITTINEIRRLAIHPLLSDHLLKTLKLCHRNASQLQDILNGLSIAAEMMENDMDKYFYQLVTHPAILGIRSPADKEHYKKLIDKVLATLREEGQSQLNLICTQFSDDPAGLLEELKTLKLPANAGIKLKDNKIRYQKIMGEAWSALISFHSIHFYDPNDVVIFPEKSLATYYYGMGCEPGKNRYHSIIVSNPSGPTNWKCTVQNLYPEAVSIRVVMVPVYANQPSMVTEYHDVDLSKTWHSEIISISAKDTSVLSFTIHSPSDVVSFIPLILLPEASVIIPWLTL